jgi:hypothetical protein
MISSGSLFPFNKLDKRLQGNPFAHDHTRLDKCDKNSTKPCVGNARKVNTTGWGFSF